MSEQHEQQHIHIDEYERLWLIGITIMLGVFFATLLAGAAIFGVRPTGQGGFVNPQQLDQTMFAEPGLRHMGGNRYEAVVLAQTWFFQPNVMTVPEGAEVTFYVTSRDVIHGFLIEHHNVNFEVIPGHIAEARTTFNEPGEYKMICSQYCGRAHQNMFASIIVEPAEDAAVAQVEGD
ncbi:MAG: cytochrome c oxidase subunit II [Chloroflexota bacterium]